MCSGPLMSKLISFCFPLMISSFLQLLFNAADLIVVGRFAGSNYLAAVGSTNALINLMINLFIGISLGANVCAARYFSAKKFNQMSAVVHTAILTAAIAGVAILILGQFASRPLLQIMGSPEDVIDYSVKYMRIYFMGTPFMLVYNFGAAILRAVGDTKRPMIFLIISGILNAGLNIFLVVKFHMNVDGVAIATVFSQFISCVLVVIVLLKSPEGYRLHFSKLRIDLKMLGKIVKIGIPAGLQSCVINLSNAMLQSSVNSLGVYAMAGYTAANNFLGFLYAAANAITQGCMSFTGQNMGVGNYKRMKKVLAYCLILETIVCLILGAVFYFFDDFFLSIYTNEPQAIKSGIEIVSITTLTYFLCGYMDCIPGSLRGMGYSSVPMILSVIGTVGVRVIWIYGFFPNHRNLRYLFISYPTSWIVTIALQSICCIIIWHNLNKKLKKSDEAEA